MKLNRYERDIITNIEKHGWFCTSVFDPDGKQQPFSYSVGFTQTLKCPEFIVFGLDVKLMHSMLWNVFRAIRDGKRPEDNQHWDGLLEGYDCVVRAVHPSQIEPKFFASAMWFWISYLERCADDMQAFQIVWPGVGDALYPWDEACPQIVRDRQPPLYLPSRQLS